MREIRFFGKGNRWSWLSNFAPHGLEDDGERWPTLEHWFQAQKFTGGPGDRGAAQHRRRIRVAGSPMQAKALGQSREVPIRADWDAVREEIMLRGLRLKFADPDLRERLLATGKRELIEDSPHDRFWGCGRDGKGKNRLGVLLMRVREELRSSTAHPT